MKRTAWSLVLVGFVLAPTLARAGAPHMGSSSRFAFDLRAGAGDGPSKNFLSIRGGGPRFTMIDYRPGQDRDDKKTTGAVEYDDVEVVLPMVAGQTGNMMDFQQIVNAWADGTNAPWNSTLVIQDRNGNEVRTIDYLGNFLESFQFPAVDRLHTGVLECRLAMKPSDVQFVARIPDVGGVIARKKPGVSRAPNFKRVAAVNGYFRAEIGGVDAGATAVVPGLIECKLTEIEDAPPAAPRYTVDGCTFGDWTFEKFYSKADTSWSDLADEFAAGVNPDGTIPPRLFLPARVIYTDRNRKPVATLNMTVLITGYEPAAVEVDKRRRQMGREKLIVTVCELSVE